MLEWMQRRSNANGFLTQGTKWVMGIFVLGGFLGCVDGEVIYVEQPAWDEPPPEAVGFLGYLNASTKVTACGNCHTGEQAEWRQTAHTHAWADLENSGESAMHCEGCHSVSNLGNSATNALVGFAATREERYHDVQCESCHGPGLAHVANPEGVKPLASFEAAIDGKDGCGACHEGGHLHLVDEWEQSAHGAGPHAAYASNISSSCMRCHEGQAALETTFGVSTTYLESGDGEFRSITCVVCHAPHGSDYPGQLRAPIDVATSENLCMKCHQNRGTPWSSHGPHAAQGLLLLGENVGYVPPGFTPPNPETTNSHGPLNNSRLCAACHAPPVTITDPSGNFSVQSVTHTFEAASCLDHTGRPLFDAECSLEERTFAGCVQSGCHGTESLARNVYVKVWERMNVLLDEIWADTDGDHVMEATDGGLLPQVIALGFESDLDPGVSDMNAAKGAMWNAMLAGTEDRPHWADGEVAGSHFSAHPSSGNGVHNPDLLEALLLASIGHVRDTYGVQPSAGFDPSPHLAGESPFRPAGE